MGNVQAIEFETKRQLEGMDIGQLVKKADKVGVFAGLEWIQTCNCPCENTFQFPIIIYLSKSGGIDREVVYSLDKPTRPNQIHGYSIIGPVNEGDRRNELYKKLIQDNLLSA
ncbi:MAG: hypothetical protein KKF68_00595 [Nanoarchaeota archaeon]|nr:hypothetical protein [Nanoarchaeota archaeon]